MHNTINRLILHQLKSPKAITPNKKLVEDLGFDSLKMMEFISTVEDEFNIAISLKGLAGSKTVGDIYRLLEEKLGTQQRSAA